MAKKIVCIACLEKFNADELEYNEAQHDQNICVDCAKAFRVEVVEEKVAALVAKGSTPKEAKKAVAAMKLDNPRDFRGLQSCGSASS
jgi:hypothetical protein